MQALPRWGEFTVEFMVVHPQCAGVASVCTLPNAPSAMSSDAAELQEEVQEAAALYREQIDELQAVLQQDPDNAEVAQLHAELVEALAAAETSLKDLQAAAAPSGVAGHLKPRTLPTSMHPENIYCQQEPDFLQLAEAHPPLQQYVTRLPNGRGALDFTSWEATRELTAALLQADHDITWSLPEGHLIPPVPNRLNYLHWIHSLLQLSCPPGPVHGLDVGCGASLIYCLLGAAVFGWSMVGLDIQPDSLAAAQQLVEANPQLQHLLEVRAPSASAAPGQAAAGSSSASSTAGRHGANAGKQHQQQHEAGILVPAMQRPQEAFAFCMCNPPFFGSIEEANQNPATACGGTAEEMVHPGGELAFIRQMIRDSQALRGRIHWYTSMCGKKATLKVLRRELHDLGVTALRTTELAQGKTSRWAIAWSYSVDVNTAAKPLPMGPASGGVAGVGSSSSKPQQQLPQQQEQPQEAGPTARSNPWAGPNVRLVRQLLWTVKASTAEGSKLLSAIAALLGTAGANSRVDQAGWCVEADVPLQAIVNMPEQQQKGPQQQQQQQAATQAEPTRPPPAKRLKAVGAPSVQVRLRLQQERRDRWTVQASIANSCGEVEARCFMRAMGELKLDLGLMWPVE